VDKRMGLGLSFILRHHRASLVAPPFPDHAAPLL